MITHIYVDRIAAQGTQTLGPRQIAEVLGCNIKNAYRLLREERIPHLKESVGYNDPCAKHEAKKFRREATVGGLLIYLLNISAGDKTDLLEAIRQRFPALHPMCLRYVEGKTSNTPLPSGVVDAREAFSAPAIKKKKPTAIKALGPGDEYQADLFDPHAHLPLHPSLLRA